MACLLAFSSLTCQREVLRCDHEIMPPAEPTITAFYPAWKMAILAPEDLPWTYLDRLIVAFAYPNADGTLDHSRLKRLPDIVNLAHCHGVEVYVSIGSTAETGAHFGHIGQSRRLRQAFVHEVVAFAESQHLDGIDIDWEYLTYGTDKRPSRLEQKSVAILLHDLNRALQPLGKSLSIDVYGGQWGGSFFLDEIERYVDHVHVMAYDYAGAWSLPRPHADVAEAFGADSIRPASGLYYWHEVRGWSKGKLHLGIPFYGRDFNDEKVPGVPFREIIAAHPPIAQSDHFNNIYYDGHPAIRRKAHRVYEEQWPGVMVWEITQDAPDSNSLLRQLYHALHPSDTLPK